jgi:hypothetical protein
LTLVVTVNCSNKQSTIGLIAEFSAQINSRLEGQFA